MDIYLDPHFQKLFLCKQVNNILFFLFGIRIFYAQSFSIYFVPGSNVIRTNLRKKVPQNQPVHHGKIET